MPWDQHNGTNTSIVINKYQLGICSEESTLSGKTHLSVYRGIVQWKVLVYMVAMSLYTKRCVLPD